MKIFQKPHLGGLAPCSAGAVHMTALPVPGLVHAHVFWVTDGDGPSGWHVIYALVFQVLHKAHIAHVAWGQLPTRQ